MNPYRQPDKDAQLDAEKQKRRAELSMFGVRQRPDGEWVPILERVEHNQCRDCSGFGTGGNPLCGAVYNCKRCNGTGYDPEPNTLPKAEWYKRVASWRNR
jgi:hypothetical protein